MSIPIAVVCEVIPKIYTHGSRERQNTPAPRSVTTSVCSNCAVRLLSLVVTVQSSAPDVPQMCSQREHRLNRENHSHRHFIVYAGAES